VHGFENIGWTVGNHCNAKCGHCYSWQVRKDSSEFLTLNDVDRVIEQLIRLGVKTVNLGGNEPIYTHGPSLRETILPEIIKKLSDRGIPVGLTTNGVTFWYLDKFHPEALKLVNDIDFSLDSPDPQEHDLNRGVALFHFVLQQIKRARSLDIDCSVITCGMRANFTPDYLERFLELCRHLDCEFRINTLKPTEPTLLSQMPTPDQFFTGMSFLMKNSDCITLGESCITALTETGDKGCPCGTTSFRINAKDAQGRISLNPCVYAHEFKSGDLLKDDILDIVQSDEFLVFKNRRENLPRVCVESNCDYLETCRGGCTARTYLSGRTLEEPDPYCPLEYIQVSEKTPDFPKSPHIGLNDGIRVHEHYLCTWIGKPHGSADGTLEELIRTPFRDLPLQIDESPISGHRQTSSASSDLASLVPVSISRKHQIK
jgi:radical SAM protein with 4Fe4S-binding SPASM domain